MTTNGTYFLHTNPPPNPHGFTSITVWPDSDNPNTTAPLVNPAPRREEIGVCPSCGRCRECGREASPWERNWMRPWWQREWVPPYQITWTYNPNDAPWTCY